MNLKRSLFQHPLNGANARAVQDSDFSRSALFFSPLGHCGTRFTTAGGRRSRLGRPPVASLY